MSAAAIAELGGAIAALPPASAGCVPRGAGTKDALSWVPDGGTGLDLRGLAGVVEYEPSEFTVTALAGTPVAELEATLEQHRQYLPFDPMLVEAGATVGGTVASGLAGSGRVRYGGVRDFVLGVRLLDGEGVLVRGGGKVVKNAAGFDLPKLLVGSLGSLGVLVEVTLKVFPRAEASATGAVELATIEQAVAALRRLQRGPTELDALDLEPPGRLWIRIAGCERVLRSRLERALAIAAGDGGDAARGEEVEPERAALHWRGMRELAWVPAGSSLVKIPLQSGRIAALDAALGGAAPAAVARYTAAGQQALVAWPGGADLAELDRRLVELELSGLVVRGRTGRRRLGRRPAEAAIERARQALDPHRRFREP